MSPEIIPTEGQAFDFISKWRPQGDLHQFENAALISVLTCRNYSTNEPSPPHYPSSRQNQTKTNSDKDGHNTVPKKSRLGNFLKAWRRPTQGVLSLPHFYLSQTLISTTPQGGSVARIRTVKPELARHRLLFDLERSTGLPVRFIWAMFPTVCCREGRFKWRPWELKLDLAPYDTFDFAEALDVLWRAGQLVRYRVNGEEFGAIKTFKIHQVINNKEKPSDIPSLDSEGVEIIDPSNASTTREPRVSIATVTPLLKDQGEGKGKEGKGTGKEGEGSTDATTREIASRIWSVYDEEYQLRYQQSPVRNAAVNSKISQIAKRLGAEAPEVVRFFVNHPKTFYVSKLHDIGLCLADAEALRTQWARGKAITESDVKKYADNQTRSELFRKIAEGKI